MITRELLNKLGKAKALEEVCPDEQEDPIAKYGVEQFQAGFTSALDLLFPGVEAAEFYGNPYSYHEGSNMRFTSVPDDDVENIGFGPRWDGAQAGGKRAREFLAKLEGEVEGK